MNVLLDECVHQGYRHELAGHGVFTAGYLGWDGIRNGRLLATAAAAGFDAMVTTDRNVEHQQNRQRLPLTVYVLNAASDNLADLQTLTEKLLAAMTSPPTLPTFVLINPCPTPPSRQFGQPVAGRGGLGLTPPPRSRLVRLTAKPWFWLVIFTRPVSRFFTGWLMDDAFNMAAWGVARDSRRPHPYVASVADLATEACSTSGSRSTPLGQTIVPDSEPTRTSEK